MGVTLRLESVRVTLARFPPGNAMAKTSPPDPAKPARKPRALSLQMAASRAAMRASQTPNLLMLGDAAACMAHRPCTR